MRVIVCCKDCTDRKVGCHATCEKYIQEKESYAKEKKIIENAQNIDVYKSGERFKKRNYQIRKYGKSY